MMQAAIEYNYIEILNSFMFFIVAATIPLIAREAAAVARAIIIVKHIKRSALSNKRTSDTSVINWYLHFVVIVIEQNTTKAAIKASKVHQMAYTLGINIEKSQILPMNNVTRLHILLTCLL